MSITRRENNAEANVKNRTLQQMREGPLEINAYELGGRFEGNPSRTFSVEERVAALVKAGRF